MYSRRDTFKVLFGAAALAIAPTLGSVKDAQAAIASPTGDLLPADGGLFFASDFPELAESMRTTHAVNVEIARDFLARFPLSRRRDSYLAALEPIEDDGMIRLPKVETYSQRAGLTEDGQQIWAHHTAYIKAVPTGTSDLDWPLGVGWEVDVVHHSTSVST